MINLKSIRPKGPYWALSIVPICLYIITITYGFIWDDHIYIVNNALLERSDALIKIWMTTEVTDFWPIAYTWIWFEKQMFGSNPMGYHVANLFLFVLSVLLLYKLLKKLNIKFAFYLAMIYAIHPMNVELVTWVIQTKSNLSYIFGLLSFIFWIKFCNTSKSGNKNYLLALTCFILSLLSKISLIFLPVLMSAYIHYKNEKSYFEKIKNISIFYFVSLVIGLINIFWYSSPSNLSPGDVVLDSNPLFRFALIGQNFWFYFVKTFIPYPLIFVHPKIDIDLNSFWTFLPSIFLGTIFFISIFFIIQKSKLANFFAGFLVSICLLFPVLGVGEIYYMRFAYVAEHWLGLAMLGFLYSFFSVINNESFHKYATFVFSIILFSLSAIYIQEYKTEKKLMQSALEKNTKSILIYNTLGIISKRENEIDLAYKYFQKSASVVANAEAYFNMASILDKQNNLDLAESYYNKSLALNAYNPQIYVSLGVLYAKKKNYTATIREFERAIQIDPKYSMAYYNMGYVYSLIGNFKKSQEWYQKALQIEPNNLLYQKALIH